MKKISVALEEIIKGNPFLRYGMSRGLFNLSKLSAFVAPLIAAQTQKSVSESAVLMALSRLAREKANGDSDLPKYKISNIHIQPELVILTYHRTADLVAKLSKLSRYSFSHENFITITQGLSEITVIISKDALTKTLEILGERPALQRKSISSISIRFAQKFINQPGFLNFILEQLALQSINVDEVASTATEFIVYIKDSDVRLAFDTLYGVFR